MNRESERKRLVEILKEFCHCKDEDCEKCSSNGICYSHREADHLLDNGIVVPPVKVGQTVYIITEVSKTIKEVAVIGIWQCASNTAIITEVGTIHNGSFGVTVFTSREEAVKMLKGDRDSGKS